MNSSKFDKNGRYIIENYQRQHPFASFLPGIAGPMGVPLWVFYVNRGQAIASFGIEDKNKPIVEFQPANKAYQSVFANGFRTFVMIRAGSARKYYEPFSNFVPDRNRKTQMRIGFNDLQITETNPEQGIETKVTYFTLPSESFAALVRKMSLKNISAEKIEGELIDGLPAVIPYGLNNWLLKEMSNTAQAWMGVQNLDHGLPFYKVRASIEDTPEVEEFEAGHFYLCFSGSATDSRKLAPIVDPEVVFGTNTALTYPERFLEQSIKDISKRTQITTGRVPAGLFGTGFRLSPREEFTVYSLIGHVDDVAFINQKADSVADCFYIEQKQRQAIELTEQITAKVETKTSSKTFDLYCRQNFLDNVLRGGWPKLFPAEKETHVCYLYSRKHGDPERDYNFFSLLAEYYSQGNGNYRDVNQNRRCDIFFEPGIEDYALNTFMNLIQTDCYNPLVIKAGAFSLRSEYLEQILSTVPESDRDGLRKILSTQFRPGQILKYIENHNIRLKTGSENFLKKLLTHSEHHEQAEFGEGYWIDHWTYCLDLIDSCLAIYPDKKREFLFDKKYTFYDNAAIVLPRSEKYVEVQGQVKQLGSVIIDPKKNELINAREEQPNIMRTEQGRGQIYKTHLFGKLLCLLSVKFSSLDPGGMGLEMEAGKPGWYDALNGLPALFGSSLSGTYELKRLIAFLIRVITEFPTEEISLATEVWRFINQIEAELNAHNGNDDDFRYWDTVSSLREAYRADTKLGFSGGETSFAIAELKPILAKFKAKIEKGLNRAKNLGGGLTPTYFVHEPLKWEVIKDRSEKVKRNDKGWPNVCVLEFGPRILPLFLEGFAKEMKLKNSVGQARELYARLRESDLYDKKLGMYKVNASLQDQPHSIGRTRAFPPGWLENESIFLHLEYKYMIELLKTGLFREFWQDAKKILVPFFDPAVYGRSILENSTFLVSSAHPDSKLHGKGFVARLSGSTAEFVNMWLIMMVGRQPFTLSELGLNLKFSPALPGWLFRKDGTLSFTFLGKIKVTYFNPGRKDIFPGQGIQAKTIKIRTGSGKIEEIEGDIIAEPWASVIRDKKVDVVGIDVYF